MSGAARESEWRVESKSVGELIEQHFGRDDPWKLALVQRHPVWDEVRIAHLLDSLLAGYPIGTLLVCKVRNASFVLEDSETTRVAAKASPETSQLVDGQQRINALVTLFSADDRFGSFYLDMRRERDVEDVLTRRRAKRRALRYIPCRLGETFSGDEAKARAGWISLDSFRKWANTRAGSLPDIADGVEREPARVTETLREIDPMFQAGLTAGEIVRAANRTARLLRVWMQKSIPVQRFTVDDPSDVLQVFMRINLAGVRVDGEDVFFAGIKTLWPQAEENLDRVTGACRLLNRMTALRLMARLASLDLKDRDLLPLRVDRLNGDSGRELVKKMRELCRPDGVELARIASLGKLLSTDSSLGHGLRLIDDGLLDHVFGWAAVNELVEDKDWLRAQLPAIETYLLSAHAFRYPTIFRDGFLSLGLRTAWETGKSSAAFPLEGVRAKVLEKWGSLAYGQRSVAVLDTEERRRSFVDRNAHVFLSILQRVPFEMPRRSEGTSQSREVEWDHIFPQARADQMKVRDSETKYLRHHDDRELVWNVGNLWALDAPINRRALDIPPSKKFALLGSLPEEGPEGLPSAWPDMGDSALTEPERAALLEAESRLAGGEIPEGMLFFRSYVQQRTDRIYRFILDRFPRIRIFERRPESNDAKVPHSEPVVEPG